MGPLHISAVVLLCIAVVWGMPMDDDTLACLKKCGNSKPCKELDDKPRKSVDSCINFIYKKCSESNQPRKCINSQADTRRGGCTKDILKSAIPCLLCEVDCEYADYDYDDESVDTTEKEEECVKQCDSSEACMAMERTSKAKLKRCEKYTDKMCRNNEETLACLVRLNTTENTRCPKSIRKNAIECMKCDENCVEDNYDSAADDGDTEECYEKCSETQSCKTFDAASQKRINDCRALSEANCADPEDMETCLESIKNISSNKCPQSFRSEVLTCVKCESKCEEGIIIGPQEEACLQECSKRASCVVMDTATDEATGMCETLFGEVCGDAEDFMACIEAYTEEDETCPISFRADVVDCMKCDQKCEDASESPSMPAMTKAACESNCNSTHDCAGQGGNIKPECKECLSEECPGNAYPECIIRATIGTCLPKCFIPSKNEKKQICDKCKADCASYP